MFSFFFHFGKEIVQIWCCFFLKCLLEFFRETMWAWKFIYYKFSFLNSCSIIHIIYFILSSDSLCFLKWPISFKMSSLCIQSCLQHFLIVSCLQGLQDIICFIPNITIFYSLFFPLSVIQNCVHLICLFKAAVLCFTIISVIFL